MKKTVRVIAIVLVFVMCLALCACGSASSTSTAEAKSKLDQIKEAGVLTVGTSADYPPYEFHTMVDGEDKIVGNEMSLMQYIADDLGVELKIVDMSFDGLIISLTQGDFDCIASCMRASEERKKTIDFSNEWYQNIQVLLVRADEVDQFTCPEDLAGHTVAAQTGTALYDWVLENAGEENTVGLSSVKDMVMELKQGTIDGILLEQLPAKSYVSHNDDLAIADVGYPIVTGENASIGVQKGNEDFVEYLNTMIAKATEEGLIEQWSIEALELAGAED